MTNYTRSIILFLSVITFSAIAQSPDDHQLHQWIKLLSVKKDPRAANLDTVLKQISKTDTSTWCETLVQLCGPRQNSNIRCQIRTRLLRHLLGEKKCPNAPSPLDNLREALQAAYEIEDEALQYEIHLRLAQIYNSMSQFGTATMHHHMLFDILHRNNR